MAFWLRDTGKLYLPPSKPLARVYNTDEYVTGTNIFFTAATERLLTVGHPYFNIKNQSNEIVVPKVSGNQYRVFRLLLPDPNQFALIEQSIYNPERERLVWRLRGIEVGRGGPLGIGSTGHPFFNKGNDTENMSVYPPKEGDDNRMNISIDPKLTQLFIVGCSPAQGEHWDKAKFCATHVVQKGECPPLELVNSVIEDGDMMDIGFGNVNNKTLFEGRAGVPLDIIDNITKWPDFLKMSQNIYGDEMFFFGRKEQVYARHMLNRAGTVGDTIPDDLGDYFYNPDTAKGDQLPQNNISSHIYVTTPSGSLNSSEGQLFNKPFWLQKAQGANNGIAWGNQLFVTIGDNTRNTNFNISVYKEEAVIDNNYKYKASDFKNYTRHVEEYEISLVLQLCKVTLDPDILAHINVMDPTILDNWKLAFVPPPPTGIEDTYRYIQSLATRCPTDEDKEEAKDPYKDLNFWTVNLTEKFTSELSQSAIGRRFLYQSGILNGKRPRSDITKISPQRASKRKRAK
ncbi:L1 [Macaca mulatta papillomavirus 7]|uniref:L1 n=1 Tax=Macaca mulatta papillomavirus 7 TaxID=2364644 RepID=UPI000EB615D9|nr:L1 [Macaca mulatta papillomavirus 7]AYD74618.1 L1 [Macaca mulatta papillomavirus 7]